MSVKQIKAFETSDGKVFTNEKEAQNHEVILEKKAGIRKIVEESFYRGIDGDSIVNMILENGKELFSLLSKRVM